MKLTLALYLILALLSSTLCVPLPSLSAEASLTDSIRSFESTWSHLDSQIVTAEEKKKAFTRREKWATGIGAGLTVIGTSGYITSAAIPMVVKHRKEHLRKVQQAIPSQPWRATGGGGGMKRRGLEEGLAKAMEEAKGEGESFHSALSRSSSQRMSDFDHVDLFKQAVSPRHMSMQLSASLPSPGKTSAQLHQNISQREEEGGTQERLAALESALLDIKQKQHEQTKLSQFSKALLGVGLANAVGGVISAELSVQNAIEAAEGKK